MVGHGQLLHRDCSTFCVPAWGLTSTVSHRCNSLTHQLRDKQCSIGTCLSTTEYRLHVPVGSCIPFAIWHHSGWLSHHFIIILYAQQFQYCNETWCNIEYDVQDFSGWCVCIDMWMWAWAWTLTDVIFVSRKYHSQSVHIAVFFVGQSADSARSVFAANTDAWSGGLQGQWHFMSFFDTFLD